MLLALPTGALGAQAAVSPPAMLLAQCETVKPGMTMAHDRHEERWSRAVEATKGFAPTLALQSMTGPAVTCWTNRKHRGGNRNAAKRFHQCGIGGWLYAGSVH